MHACLFFRAPLDLPQSPQEATPPRGAHVFFPLAERAWQFFAFTPMEDEHEDELQQSPIACFSQFCD